MCDYVIDFEHRLDCIIKLFIGSLLHGFKYLISVKYFKATHILALFKHKRMSSCTNQHEYASKKETDQEICCQASVSGPIDQVLTRRVAKRHRFTLLEWLQLGLYRGTWKYVISAFGQLAVQQFSPQCCCR